MDFHPDHLFDTNQGENFVWSALKKAFQESPGSAFYRYSIVGSDHFVRYEPDVLLLVPQGSLLLLECKGCRIGDIDDIAGSTWSMSTNWYRREEHPAVQARSQAIELRRMFEGRGINGVKVQALVALPFVSAEDWRDRGFDVQASTGGILFAEDFDDPSRLRETLQRRLVAHSLDAPRYQRVMACLGGKTLQEGAQQTPSDPPRSIGTINVLRYSGRPPTGAEILQAIGIEPGSPYTYLVATAALERHRRRGGLGGQHQLKKDLRKEALQPEEMQLLFWKALRHFIGRPVLKRSEQLLLLQRAIRAVAGQDSRMADQLRHDVFAWRDVFADLEEAGEAMAAQIIANEADWSHPSLSRVAQALQAAYRKERHTAARAAHSFEDLAGQYIVRGYRPTPVVILEGFTRLTTLQRRFIEHCANETDCRVWIVQPYVATQARGFTAISQSYDVLSASLQVLEIETGPLSEGPALSHVQQGLFRSDATALDFPGDDSVQLRVFAHSNDEVAACVDAVLQALDDPHDPRPANEIAIVCSDAPAMTELLREEAERRGRGDLFALPPRQLLLTPVGRFALTLYEVWTPSGLNLDPEQLTMLLASGWLGGQAQRSVELFVAVAAQQFTHCRSDQQWRAAFERIRSQRADNAALGRLTARLPASRVDSAQLAQWEEVVLTVVQLCGRLFASGERPLGAHISQLLDEIERLDPHRILQAEREVLARIREALADLVEARSVGVHASEFGQILSGLIHERQHEQDGELSGDSAAAFPARVWVVGPEGIDNVTRHTVFFLGVDDRRMPAPGVPPWPRMNWSAQEHVGRQRYRFLAVVRAAQQRLWLSFSRHDWERDYRPSPYLEEVARLLERQRHLAAAEAPSVEFSDGAAVPTATKQRQATFIQRDEYEIDELALFRLCPHRFKLEALSDGGRCYGSDWQLQWLARGAWLAQALFKVSNDVHDAPAPTPAMDDRLVAALEFVRPMVEARFGGISKLAWITIESSVRNSIARLVRPAGKDQLELDGISLGVEYGARKELALDAQRSVSVPAYADYRQIRGKYVWPLMDTNQVGLWLMAGQKEATPSEGADGDAEVFRSLYSAVQWWRTMSLRIASSKPLSVVDKNDLLDTVLQVEAGHFPKNPGDHCKYCPAQPSCMGLKP